MKTARGVPDNVSGVMEITAKVWDALVNSGAGGMDLGVLAAAVREAIEARDAEWAAKVAALEAELARAQDRIAEAPAMFALLEEIDVDGYMAELIAHKIVSGLRCREEQECYAKIQALLKRVRG